MRWLRLRSGRDLPCRLAELGEPNTVGTSIANRETSRAGPIPGLSRHRPSAPRSVASVSMASSMLPSPRLIDRPAWRQSRELGRGDYYLPGCGSRCRRWSTSRSHLCPPRRYEAVYDATSRSPTCWGRTATPSPSPDAIFSEPSMSTPNAVPDMRRPVGPMGMR